MIKLINPLKIIKEGKLKGPVTSPNYFLGGSFSFHPQGLQSEEIFGIEGSPDRRNSLSWIELNCQVFHPVIYDIISKTIARHIVNLISGEKRYNLNEDGFLVESEDGELSGFTSLIKNIDKIRFRRDEKSEEEDGTDRNRIIEMLYDRIKDRTIFMDKLIVISPEFRPISVPDKLEERPMIDEMNDIYVRAINLSNQLKSVSGDLYDILSYRMQLILRDLHEIIRVRVSKKQGIIRNLMLGKRVDFSSRSVITPNPELNLGEVGLPLRMCCSIFEPYLIYGLVNSNYADQFPDQFHSEVKDFLGKELDPELLL